MGKLITTKIVGTASQTKWSQAQTVQYQEDHQVLVVIQLSCHDEAELIDLTTIGSEILLEIEGKGAELVESNLESEVKKLIEEMPPEIAVEIMVGVQREDSLSVFGKGKVEALVVRDGKIARLRDSWGAGECVFGRLLPGDRVLISSAMFVENLGEQKLGEILINDQSPAEMMAPLVHTQEDSSGVAVIVGEVKGQDQKKKLVLASFLNREPRIKLSSKEPRKMNLWIGGGILVLLILMIGIGVVRRAKVGAEREYAAIESSVNSKLSEASSAGDLNPERARTLLVQARGEVDSYLLQDVREEYRLKAQELIRLIEETEQKTFKKNEVGLSSILELDSLLDGLVAKKMKSDGRGNLIFLSEDGETAVSMNLRDRSRQVVEAESGEKLIDVATTETKVFGLIAAGVSEIDFEDESVESKIEADEFWKSPAELEMFAGNAYVFDREQSEIWKYSTLGDGEFAGRGRWLAAGITPDLSNVVDMKISGDIWLLTSTGKLERYSRGAPVTFSMEGFPSSTEAKRLSSPTAMFVTENEVYVLENGASRVVVFGEDGKYQSQYTNTEFAGASDIVVVDDKGYVIVGNMVKEFGL